MPKTDSQFLGFIQRIVNGDIDEVTRRLKDDPSLATTASDVGATRQNSKRFFFPAIAHYLYAGDTALHMAAAAHQPSIAKLLVKHGASPRAKNRRGAQPLHYAADGSHIDPKAQAQTIQFVISTGADPNALDSSGVAPLHRAVRNRSYSAVKALLDGGTNVRLPNKSGSTPSHLAVQTTGKSGSGSPQAREAQKRIIQILLERGARPMDKDGRGRSVQQAATSQWVKALLQS